MVCCVYAPTGEWVPMGRARTRCPKCGGALVEEHEFERRFESTGLKAADSFHVVVLREPLP
jgi:hypothetical protein